MSAAFDLFMHWQTFSVARLHICLDIETWLKLTDMSSKHVQACEETTDNPIFWWQGERGPPGPPGIQGETGIGMPGPKVCRKTYLLPQFFFFQRCLICSFISVCVNTSCYLIFLGWHGIPGTPRSFWSYRHWCAWSTSKFFSWMNCPFILLSQQFFLNHRSMSKKNFPQGPQGPQGVQGEKGPTGEGLPGPKVLLSFENMLKYLEICWDVTSRICREWYNLSIQKRCFFFSLFKLIYCRYWQTCVK